MKLTKQLFGIALATIATGALVSCSNDLNEPGGPNGNLATGIRLAKSADIRAWSGDQDLSNIIGTRGDGILQADRVNDGVLPKITETELLYVIDYIAKYPNGGTTNCNIKAPYYIQQVGGAENKYTFNDMYTDVVGNTQMTQLYIDGQFATWNNASLTPQKEGDLKISGVDMVNPSYMDTHGNVEQRKENAYRFYYVKFEENDKYPDLGELKDKVYCYLCFDYRSKKDANEQETYDYPGDNIYNDYIIKVTPSGEGGEGIGDVVYPTGYDDDKTNGPSGSEDTDCECTEDEDCTCDPGNCECGDDCDCEVCNPEQSTGCTCNGTEDCNCPEGTCQCDNCQDNNGDDNGDNNNGDDNKGNDTPKPEVPSGITKSEVEVNLSINDYHTNYPGIKDLVAKLSIHVRHAGDVEVFIPVKAEYYCSTDDLYILKDHNEGNFVHGGDATVDAESEVVTSQTLTYQIAGVDVKLTVAYEADGIRVTTDGINETVFNYLVENFGDGVNFEVMLYFNDATDDFNAATLKGMLDESTIKFLDGYPDYYINAFGRRGAYNGKDSEKPDGVYTATVTEDCTVDIFSDQKSNFGDPTEDAHLNGTTTNQIYKSKSCTGPEGAHDHAFLWYPQSDNSGSGTTTPGGDGTE